MKKNLIYTPRVQVSHYSAMSDQLLQGDIRAIVAAVNAIPDPYKDVKTIFDAMALQFDKFDAALLAAADKAIPAVNVKNYERKILLAKVNEFGLALAAYCNGDPTYITNTTMKLTTVPTGNRLPKEVQAPSIKKVVGNGAPGTLMIEMARLLSPAVIVAMEYKTEDMAEWKNGRYFNKTRMTIKDLPEQTNVSCRFLSIDGFGNKSTYTETFTVSVA